MRTEWRKYWRECLIRMRSGVPLSIGIALLFFLSELPGLPANRRGISLLVSLSYGLCIYFGIWLTFTAMWARLTYESIKTGKFRPKNNALAFVELEMKAAGILDFATKLQNPNFARMAEAAGLLGLTADVAEQVQPMISQALAHDGPALVEGLVHRQELAMPPTISLDQVAGLGLFMLKAVLSGRGDEVIDLAKVNLFR